MRKLDQEDRERMAKCKETKELEEKARRDAAEAAWQKQAQEEVARAVESPPRDENNKELDYYDDLDRDTEMASSQETASESSQEMASASQESVCQGSVSQDMASMPSQDSTTNATILDATGGILMEDEACLEGPTL